jgi:hypothetical protein
MAMETKTKKLEIVNSKAPKKNIENSLEQIEEYPSAIKKD